MPDAVDLPPARFAALVAPAIDRVFIRGIRASAGGHDLVLAYGGPRAIGYLIDLRNPLAAGRTISADGLLAHYRYDDPAQVQQTVQRSVHHGLLKLADDGSITATDRGHKFLADLAALHAGVLTELWEAEHRMQVERLVGVAGRLLHTAEPSGGPAWSVQAPPYEPPETPASVLLLNRLSALRAHRADAHAAAWEAAGLTAQQIVTMPPGPEREAIEDSTNERAGAPYAALDPEERLAMLADLAALP